MSELTFNAEVRTVLGKKVSQLRRDGLVPGVVYGPVVSETVQVSVNRRDFDRFYKTHGHSTLFTLVWDGGSRPVFIREVQQDPIRRAPLHIDFFAPNLRQTLRASVQVVFQNQAEQIDGVLTEVRTEVEIEALPTDVPHQIDVDIAGLTSAGDAVHVSDIAVPAGVTIVTPPEELLAQIVAQVVEAEPTDEAATEAETAVEAAADADAAGTAENE